MPLPRRNVTLEDDKYAILVAYGDGIFAEGCRRAAELVQATETITLASEDFDRFVDTCQSPAPHNEKLIAAMRRRDDRKGEEKNEPR